MNICLLLLTKFVVRRCSLKNMFLKISQNLLKNSCVGASFLIKLEVYGKTKVFSSFYRTPVMAALVLSRIRMLICNIEYYECINRQWWDSYKHSYALQTVSMLNMGSVTTLLSVSCQYMFELEREYKQVNRKNIFNVKKKSMLPGFIN